jgi:hypothetical protein
MFCLNDRRCKGVGWGWREPYDKRIVPFVSVCKRLNTVICNDIGGLRKGEIFTHSEVFSRDMDILWSQALKRSGLDGKKEGSPEGLPEI